MRDYQPIILVKVGSELFKLKPQSCLYASRNLADIMQFYTSRISNCLEQRLVVGTKFISRMSVGIIDKQILKMQAPSTDF